MTKKLRVIDFFCGAGGFSEGFRQQGFEIVMGIDNWAPAIATHNLNHNLHDTAKDVLDFKDSIVEINKLPDTEVIIGSPPCVLFSLSNKGGNSDKSLGIKLIESYLRVIAVKKHQPSTKLVAWFMENVPNSGNYIKSAYTFRDLNLDDWAKELGIDPDQVALNGTKNGVRLNTANFGVSQKRERFLCGELIVSGKFPDLNPYMTSDFKTLGKILESMPSPNNARSKRIYRDPNYKHLELQADKISDHYYDTGIYEKQWSNARMAKWNHPYMGKMSFPENLDRPSRTILATRSKTTREAIIYRSEYKRSGDGEYRLPTIREIATIMGFPYTYQFIGGESNKWRQIGNAVPPPLSVAIAKSVRASMGLKKVSDSKVKFTQVQAAGTALTNLNTYSEISFDKPPKKKANSRFRMHPLKSGNITVALTNYNPLLEKSDRVGRKWYSSIFIGTGRGFVQKVVTKNRYKEIEKLLVSKNGLCSRFINDFNQKFKHIPGNTSFFQNAYVENSAEMQYNPCQIIERLGEMIHDHIPDDEIISVPGLFPTKEQVPLRQVIALYAINRIVS